MKLTSFLSIQTHEPMCRQVRTIPDNTIETESVHRHMGARPMSDQMLIKDGKILLTTEEGKSVEKPESQLEDMLRGELLPPLNGTAFPDGIKFYDWKPPYFLVVHQLPPHVRQFRWIANDSPARFGPETKYRKVRLSIPYTITFSVFMHQRNKMFICDQNELYFRNEPLRTKKDKLCYPALLNISRIPQHGNKRDMAWICTQYLGNRGAGTWIDQLQTLLEHVWNGGFNLSSEDHEGASWYGASEGIHKELHPVEKWEKATASNDAFALTVPWKPAPLTVEELMETIMKNHQANTQNALVNPDGTVAKPLGLVNRFMNFTLKPVIKPRIRKKT